MLTNVIDNANTYLILADGPSMNADGFRKVIEAYAEPIKMAGAGIIGIIAVIFVLKLIIKMIPAIANQKYSDAAKQFVGIAIIVALAALGVAGVFSLVDSINPVQDKDQNVTSIVEKGLK